MPRANQQCAIERLGKIIAQLVGAVDATLHLGERGVGCARRARFVLNMPEIEVGAMLVATRARQRWASQSSTAPAGSASADSVVPTASEAVMQADDRRLPKAEVRVHTRVPIR